MARDMSLGSASPSATHFRDSLAEHVRNRSGSGSRQLMKMTGRRVVPTFETRDITTQSPSCVILESIPDSRCVLSCLSFRIFIKFSSQSTKAWNSVIRAFDLEHSLNPLHVIQKSIGHQA